MNRFLHVRPSPAMVVACAALFVSLGGVGYAAIVLPANSVGTKQLKRNAVNSAKVKKYSLLRSDFKRGQIPRGPQGVQGIQGSGHPGPEGRSRHPCDPTLGLRERHRHAQGRRWRRRVKPTDQRLFQRDVQPVDRQLCRDGELPARDHDVGFNLSNHFRIIQLCHQRSFRINIWNSTINEP